VVQNLLNLTQTCYVHALNLCEVYYDFWRASSQEAAESAITDLMVLGIEERNAWTRSFGVQSVASKPSTAECRWLTAAHWRWLTGWAPSSFPPIVTSSSRFLQPVHAKSN